MARAGGGLDAAVGNERVILGVGDSAVFLVDIPDCGCDACDMGSDVPLRELDEYFLSVVFGEFRQLSLGEKRTTVLGVDRDLSGGFRRVDPDFLKLLLERYTGWHEVRGASWLGDDRRGPKGS